MTPKSRRKLYNLYCTVVMTITQMWKHDYDVLLFTIKLRPFATFIATASLGHPNIAADSLKLTEDKRLKSFFNTTIQIRNKSLMTLFLHLFFQSVPSWNMSLVWTKWHFSQIFRIPARVSSLLLHLSLYSHPTNAGVVFEIRFKISANIMLVRSLFSWE